MKNEIYSLDDTARAAGVSYSRLNYHVSIGSIPPPDRWNGNGRKVYTAEGLEAVKRFFAERALWTRSGGDN